MAARHQPQRLLRLDRAGLTAGMRLATLPGVNRTYDAASMRAAVQSVGMLPLAYPGGVAAGFGAAVGIGSSDKITTASSGAFPAAGRTYFFVARRNGNGGGNLGRLFDKTSGSSGQFLYCSSSTGLNYGFYSGGAERAAQIDSRSSSALAIGEWFIVLVTHEHVGTTSLIRTYLNGVQLMPATFSGALNDAPSTPYCIGNRNSDNARGWDGAIACAYAWDRILADDEIAGLFSSNWRVWAGDDEDEDPDSAAPVGRILPIGGAALVISGSQVGMRVSRRLRAAPAALAVSAGPVALRAARRMSVQPDGLAMSAGSAQMLISRRLGVQPAALAVTGQGITLRAGRRLRVEPVELGLAGAQVGMQYAPTLVPGSYTLPVSAAAMTLGGGAVGTRVTRRLPIVGARLGLVGGNVLFQVGRQPGLIDVSAISPARIVTFEGSGSRLVIFEGSGSRVVVFEGSGQRVRVNDMDVKVPIKVGDKWVTDRDRDEISYYAADITNELAHRNTTPVAEDVTAPVYGVELLEGPQVQVAEIDGVQRTLVVVKLGGIDGGDLPDDWRWVARVPCANGERFDKTTWFNEVDP